MKFNYPVYSPSIGHLEKEFVLDCLETTWISSRGKYVDMFEHSLSAYIEPDPKKRGEAIAVSNGTVALHLAMLALGVSAGDEVIVPSFTYIASTNCVEYVGATPVFADCNESDWGIDPAEVLRLITPKTKAVICVHLYGVPTDAKLLRKICDDNGIFLVEDCAESLGAVIHGQQTGKFGHIATYSFFGNKTITTGEGGAIYTEIQSIYDRAVRLKSQGLAMHREYWHDIIGYNFRMTNIAAAIGVAQMSRIDEILERKRQIDQAYQDELHESGCSFQKVHSSGESSAWMTTPLFSSEKERDYVRSYLRGKGIETRPTFFPVHTMPMYATRYYWLKTTEDISLRGINLPSYPSLQDNDIAAISGSVKDAISCYEREAKS